MNDFNKNTPPVAVEDAAATAVNTSVVIDLLANDHDPDGDAISFYGVPMSPDGWAEINPDGTITFHPNHGFVGVAEVTYYITDGNGGISQSTAYVTVGNSRDGIVDGTDGDDLIDYDYNGDPDGDLIDHGDAILPGEAPEDDIVLAGAGNDTILSGLGDDEVYGGDGSDEVDAGEGDDFVDTSGSAPAPDRGAPDGSVLPDSDPNDDRDFVDGGLGNDTIMTGDDADTILGGAGDDVIDSGLDDDVVDGGLGNDTIMAGDGNDTVEGGDGNDVIDTSGDYPASDYGFAPLGLDPDADPDNDRDLVDGGAGDDVIMTGDDADTIAGGTGADTIDGGLDDDLIDAGEGADSVIGGHGSDEIDGGAGDDVLWGGMGPDTDALNIPDEDIPGDYLPADARPDNGMDTIHGGAGNDAIYGQDDADVLFGDAGNDTVDGGIDNDSISGGEGNDELIGGQGEDTLDGGAGDDVMSGGDDEDLFINVNAGDVVDGGAGGTTPADDFDTLDLRGSAPDGGSLKVTITGPDSNGNGFDGYVTYFDDTGTETGTLNFAEIEDIIPCFTPGTMIATPRGEVAVEELREGDKIITRDNGIQEIRWVGAKSLDWKALGRAEHLKPVLVKAGALGNGLPERDMMVSPNHRVLVANDRTALYFEEREVLVAAKHLVDNAGVSRVDVMGTTYIHFMCDHHEVVLSNGAWTESFQPGDHSLKGIGNAQRQEIFELFPELEHREGVENYAAARRTLKRHEARVLLK